MHDLFRDRARKQNNLVTRLQKAKTLVDPQTAIAEAAAAAAEYHKRDAEAEAIARALLQVCINIFAKCQDILP